LSAALTAGWLRPMLAGPRHAALAHQGVEDAQQVEVERVQVH
jgi:hypothetical protein